jgi:ubiquitin-protein ligase
MTMAVTTARSAGDGEEEPDIRFSEADLGLLLRALARIYNSEERASRFLRSIRFRPELIPGWRDGATAMDFWSLIFEELDRGVMTAPYRQLLLAALETYATNEDLVRLNTRYTTVQAAAAAVQPAAGEQPAHTRADEAVQTPQPGQTCRLVVWVGLEEREALEAWLDREGLGPQAAWLTPTSASYLVNETEPHALEQRMRDVPGLNWTIVAPGDPDYVIRYLSVQGPDGRSFRFNDVPSATPVGSVASELVDQYNGGLPGGDQPTVVEHVGADGPRRMNPDNTLADEGITEGARLRVGFERRAAAPNPLDRRDALFRVRNQLLEYEETHPGFVLTPNSSALPTEYDIEFARPSFGPPAGAGEEPADVSVHQLSIVLGPDFPITAPTVHWLTDIFHPNIYPTYESEALRERPYARGLVCLGTLTESYQPSLDFGELCATLEDIAGYQNYTVYLPVGTVDAATGRTVVQLDFFDRRAAEWAASAQGQERIRKIGGATVFKGLVGRPGRLGLEIDVDMDADTDTDTSTGRRATGPA